MVFVDKHGNKNGQSSFLTQGLILAIAGIIVRIIGLFYRIPMINIIGEKGNGYYTSAYSIYSLFLIMSSYSLPVALSKIISHRLSRKRYNDAYKAFKVAILLATIVGVLMFLIVYFGATTIANITQKPYLKYSLEVFAPTLLIMSFLSVFRGLFQGMGSMVPTAISQIFEQIVNAAVSLICCYIFYSQGLLANVIYENTEYAYAFGAKGATMGTLAGSATALVILFFMFLGVKNKLVILSKRTDSYETYRELAMVIFLTVLPIILSSLVYNCFSVVADVIYSNIVRSFGNYEMMVFNWGVYGQFHLLFNIPVAFSSSLNSSILPAITNAVAARDGLMAVRKIKYAIRFTLLMLLPAFIGLSVLAFPICKLLFGAANNSLLVLLTRFGSVSVVFFGLSTITSGILHGLDKMDKPILHGLIGLIIAGIVLAILLLVFKIDIFAVVVANIVFAFIISILNLYIIVKITHLKDNIFDAVIYPLASAVIMGACVYFISNFILKILPTNVSTLSTMLLINIIISIIVGIFIYLFLIINLGCVRKKDAAFYPLFGRIERLLKE